MALDDIKNKIISEAEKKAQEILQKAQEEAEQILKKGQERANQIKKDLLTKVEREAQIKKNKIISASRLEIKKKVLEVKQASLAEAFRLATERIIQLPEEEYLEFIRNILLQTPISNKAIVITNERDRARVTEEFLEQISSSLLDSGKEIRLTLSPETRDIQGGIIISMDDIEINHSLEIVLRFLRDELELKLAQILFEDL
jgi:V/A-type H+-transporting ATPase subunit E